MHDVITRETSRAIREQAKFLRRKTVVTPSRLQVVANSNNEVIIKWLDDQPGKVIYQVYAKVGDGPWSLIGSTDKSPFRYKFNESAGTKVALKVIGVQRDGVRPRIENAPTVTFTL